MATVVMSIGNANTQTTPNISGVSGSGDGPYTVDFASAYHADIEVGDLLEDGGNVFFRISALVDADTMTVFSAVGAGAGPATGATTGTDRAFTSTAGVDAAETTWTASGDTWQLELHSEGGAVTTTTNNWAFDGLGTSGTMVFTCAPGEGPVRGQPGTGCILSNQTTDWVLVLVPAESTCPSQSHSNMEMIGKTNVTSNGAIVTVGEDGTGSQTATFENLILHQIGNNGGSNGCQGLFLGNGADNTGTEVRNCIAYDINDNGSGDAQCFLSVGNNNTFDHCTAYAASTTGGIAQQFGSAIVAKNCVSMVAGAGPAFSAGSSWGAGSDYNCDDDATAPGGNSQASKTDTDQFVSVTGGSEDFRLILGADCIDNGTGSQATDITGRARDASPDIGAFEYQRIPVKMHHYKQLQGAN